MSRRRSPIPAAEDRSLSYPVTNPFRHDQMGGIAVSEIVRLTQRMQWKAGSNAASCIRTAALPVIPIKPVGVPFFTSGRKRNRKIVSESGGSLPEPKKSCDAFGDCCNQRSRLCVDLDPSAASDDSTFWDRLIKLDRDDRSTGAFLAA